MPTFEIRPDGWATGKYIVEAKDAKHAEKLGRERWSNWPVKVKELKTNGK